MVKHFFYLDNFISDFVHGLISVNRRENCPFILSGQSFNDWDVSCVLLDACHQTCDVWCNVMIAWQSSRDKMINIISSQTRVMRWIPVNMSDNAINVWWQIKSCIKWEKMKILLTLIIVFPRAFMSNSLSQSDIVISIEMRQLATATMLSKHWTKIFTANATNVAPGQMSFISFKIKSVVKCLLPGESIECQGALRYNALHSDWFRFVILACDWLLTRLTDSF